jgi:hypothetical protein
VAFGENKQRAAVGPVRQLQTNHPAAGVVYFNKLFIKLISVAILFMS